MSEKLYSQGHDKTGAGAPESEEITPAMIEAGADIIWSRFDDVFAYGSSTGQALAIRSIGPCVKAWRAEGEV
jgi:hypothetical protein